MLIGLETSDVFYTLRFGIIENLHIEIAYAVQIHAVFSGLTGRDKMIGILDYIGLFIKGFELIELVERDHARLLFGQN